MACSVVASTEAATTTWAPATDMAMSTEVGVSRLIENLNKYKYRTVRKTSVCYCPSLFNTTYKSLNLQY